jgi:hypothetical protein
VKKDRVVGGGCSCVQSHGSNFRIAKPINRHVFDLPRYVLSTSLLWPVSFKNSLNGAKYLRVFKLFQISLFFNGHFCFPVSLTKTSEKVLFVCQLKDPSNREALECVSQGLRLTTNQGENTL